MQVNDDTIFEVLETCLKEHDWYYMMSDDQEVYLAGKASGARIRYLMERAKELDRQKAWDLYSKYCPYHVKKEA